MFTIVHLFTRLLTHRSPACLTHWVPRRQAVFIGNQGCEQLRDDPGHGFIGPASSSMGLQVLYEKGSQWIEQICIKFAPGANSIHTFRIVQATLGFLGPLGHVPVHQTSHDIHIGPPSFEGCPKRCISSSHFIC